MPIKILCHGESHVGKRRADNEDQFLIADLNKSMDVAQTSLGLSTEMQMLGGSQGKLLLVADGLGGHASGERASKLAVDGVTNYILNAMDWFFHRTGDHDRELMEGLKKAFHHGQERLTDEANEIPQRRGMATTLTLNYIAWPVLYVVHVGDTRCYLVSDNNITQLTTDHNIANLADSAGASVRTKSAAEDETMKHTLWNVIGGRDLSLEPEVSRHDLRLGDRLIICSDGLTGYVSDDELLSVVCQMANPEEACGTLIQMANDRGGRDNITVIVASTDPEPKDLADTAVME